MAAINHISKRLGQHIQATLRTMLKNMSSARGSTIMQGTDNSIKVKRKIYLTMNRNGQGHTRGRRSTINERSNIRRAKLAPVLLKIMEVKRWAWTIFRCTSRRNSVRRSKSSLVLRRNMISTEASCQSLPTLKLIIIVSSILGHLLACWSASNGSWMWKNAQSEMSRTSRCRAQWWTQRPRRTWSPFESPWSAISTARLDRLRISSMISITWSEKIDMHQNVARKEIHSSRKCKRTSHFLLISLSTLQSIFSIWSLVARSLFQSKTNRKIKTRTSQIFSLNQTRIWSKKPSCSVSTW